MSCFVIGPISHYVITAILYVQFCDFLYFTFPFLSSDIYVCAYVVIVNTVLNAFVKLRQACLLTLLPTPEHARGELI